MSTMHDIYDPPPAPLPLIPPSPERLRWTAGDLATLATLLLAVALVSGWAWTVDPSMAALTTIGGLIVIAETWSTALGFLHRRPEAGASGRWKIFVAALMPWLVGLGLAAALMLALFRLADRFAA